MPDLASLFHHVVVDVSSVKALCLRWYPKVSRNQASLKLHNALHLIEQLPLFMCTLVENKKALSKKNKHRAMDDIRESIAELKYFKEHIFKPSKARK
ncbi:polynucleotidyl transferase, ribonuclease H-like superfamily protein [Actinidia rufa]|uniref:Polynucleotidyl transferase, ribonuclease H-like superfamily protein n=1 Tax=Actinidia rufa TaxID=165716 RepID=A0A7J0FSV1_9ERIC|nr:polynucleotidyl transferase, ribonuclease H-like superfamily protein [Actinidia rufa]